MNISKASQYLNKHVVESFFDGFPASWKEVIAHHANNNRPDHLNKPPFCIFNARKIAYEIEIWTPYTCLNWFIAEFPEHKNWQCAPVNGCIEAQRIWNGPENGIDWVFAQKNTYNFKRALCRYLLS